jgi:hypothetical protein
MIASSCQKETIDPNPPNPPSPIPVDTSGIDSSISLQQQTWVLDAYKIQEFGSITPVGDTLHFLTTTQYQYNGQASTYSFYPVSSSYNLTLNGTFLGNISGTIYEYNLSNGLVTGIKFNDITPGGSQQYYYLWMHKIN